MKIIRVKPTDNRPSRMFGDMQYDGETNLLHCHLYTHLNQVLGLTKDDGIVHGLDVDLNFDIDIKRLAGDVYDFEAALDCDNGTYDIICNLGLRNCDYHNGLPRCNTDSDRRLGSLHWRSFGIMSVAIDDNYDVVIFMHHCMDKIDVVGTECEDIALDMNEMLKHPGRYNSLSMHSELARKRFEAYKFRSNLFKYIDYKDSIGYLEAQIDILSRFILKNIVSDNLDDYDDESKELIKFLKKADGDSSSLLSLKSIDKLTQSAIKNKEIFRTAQREFHDNISNI